ncbi:fructokinase [Virgisporangium aliadipatigenens]|uniref:Fructokinase n=1 Tax=Virgisporangium aliadipatigenens TaxID=741659 RepID=A0A8J4DVJ8_9ACTN|nr:carbohydrate kinase [Virgisporangium aliadipatigenens]GIJ51521.1 fructokinase [Virgisporangium aliadipatigenens]
MIVVCGEALVDLIRSAAGESYLPRPGGSAANVAAALGRLGADVTLVARISQDRLGELLREHLRRSLVRLEHVVDADEHTTLAIADLLPGGDAAYTFYIDGCADGRWRADELPAALPDGAALHVSGSLALAVPTMGDALEGLIRRERRHRVISLDPNPRSTISPEPDSVRARLSTWLPLADIVKIGTADLEWIAPGQPYELVARQWHLRGCALVVVTRGGKGVYALGPDGPVDLPANPVELVDTVGAGDAFMAGLLAALDRAELLTRDRLSRLGTPDLSECLRFAQRVAAHTCARQGAEPPWLEELRP